MVDEKIKSIVKELKELRIWPEGLRIQAKKDFLNFKSKRKKIIYDPIFLSIDKRCLRIVLLHELAHKKIPQYALPTLFSISTALFFVTFILNLKNPLVNVALLLIVFSFMFKFFKEHLKQDEYNADLWASWHYKKYYGGKASPVLKKLLMDAKVIRDKYLEEHKFLKLKHMIKKKIIPLDIHPSTEERVGFVKKYLDE